MYDSNRKITISFKGEGGQIIASGWASPNDMESFGSLNPKLFNGRAMAVIRSGYKKGEITSAVSSEGLRGSTIQLKAK